MVSLHDKLSAAGKRGGAATKARYGVDHFRHLGQGRPTFFESVRRAREREEAAKKPSKSTVRRYELRSQCPHCGESLIEKEAI